MTANSADAQKLWGYVGGDGGDGGDVSAALLVRQAPNAAGPIVYGDFLFSEAAGAAPAVFVGTTAIAFSQVGSLLAGTALTGTTPLTFSQTGDFTAGSLVGNADFVGTTTLVFGQTGVFAARAAFVGSTPVAFSQAGTLRGAASLSGTSTIVFSQSGTLRGGAGLQGTTALSFAQTGSFVAGAGGANAVFVGASTITFGQSGEFVAEVAPVLAQDFDYHDGSTSKSKSTEEVQQELYREYQQGIRDTIAKFSNPPKDEPEAVEAVQPDKPLPATLTRLLEFPDTTALADIVNSYDALNAGLDALLDIRQQAQQQQNEDDEIAIMLAMGDL